MAKSRYVPYGYCIRDGKIEVNINESEIVKRIFALYIDGSSYNEIAKFIQSDKIIYGEATDWNKNIVGRILHNKKYMGNKKYPIIIEKVLFDKVIEKISTKSSRKAFLKANEISNLKDLMRCNNCGKRMNYQNGKWLCSKCKTVGKMKYETVSKRIVKMINELIEHPDIVDVPPAIPYEPNMEIKRLENDIYRQLEKHDCNEEYSKSLIKKLVDLKYRVCYSGDASRRGRSIKELIMGSRSSNRVNTELLMKIAERIIVQENGDFFIVLKNGQKIM